MRPGYRHLNLRSIFDEPLENATLLIHVAFTQIDCPLLSSNMTSSVTSSPTNLTPRPIPLRRNGSSSAIQRWPSRKKSRASVSGSLSSRDLEGVSLRTVGIAAFDAIFTDLSSPLGKVAAIRDVVNVVLAAFRESCGLPAPACVKRCLRNLYERARRRPEKERNAVGRDEPPIVVRKADSRPLQLEIGTLVVGDDWKRTQQAFDQLVAELSVALDISGSLPQTLRSALQSISNLFKVCIRGRISCVYDVTAFRTWTS